MEMKNGVIMPELISKVISTTGDMLGYIGSYDGEELEMITIAKLKKFTENTGDIAKDIIHTIYVMDSYRIKRMTDKVCDMFAKEIGGTAIHKITTKKLYGMILQVLIWVDKPLTKSKMRWIEKDKEAILSDIEEELGILNDTFEICGIHKEGDDSVEVTISVDTLIQRRAYEGLDKTYEEKEVMLNKNGELVGMHVLGGEDVPYILDKECSLYYIKKRYGLDERELSKACKKFEDKGAVISKCKYACNKAMTRTIFHEFGKNCYSLVCGNIGKITVDRMLQSMETV